MLPIWILLVFHSEFTGSVLCAYADGQSSSEDVAENNACSGSGDVQTSSCFGDDMKYIHDAKPHTSHFSERNGEVCSSLTDNLCDRKKSSHIDDVDEELEDHVEKDSSLHLQEKRVKSDGWFSDWDLMFSNSDENSILNKVPEENSNIFRKKTSVKILLKKGDFENFIRSSHVVIVFFYKNVKSESLLRFLMEYDISSDHLLQYGIFLAVADCEVYAVGSYCSTEKVNRFAYGYREGIEKIAFPLDTLFNNNAIVASALHLDLINAVPILQTAGERHELERRCKGHCDIIFSFQRTLGTYEHRMFLEIAHAYQDSYVFAITTYLAGTVGLPDIPFQENEDAEQRVWVIHCADSIRQEQCIVSHFRQKMLLAEMLQFIAALQLPKWHDLDVSPVKPVVMSPYDGTSLPWVILIYDSSCKHRVVGLAPNLAQLLHGTVATVTLDIEKINEDALKSLGLERAKIVTPAVAFISQDQEKTEFLNDYDDPLEWVDEQLAAIFNNPKNKEEMGYQPVQTLEELLQDDEVVKDIQKEDALMNVLPLNGPEAYTNAMKSNSLKLIAFYLAWDPISNMLLQHMNEIVPQLRNLGGQATLHRLNCYGWPRLCDGLGIAGYPELRLYPKNEPNILYNGPISFGSLMNFVLLFEQPTPVELDDKEEVEKFLLLHNDFHRGSYFMNAAAVGIFPTLEDSVAYMEASKVLRPTHLTGWCISKEAADICGSNSGCIIVSKPKDPLQPRVALVMKFGIESTSRIIAFLRHTTEFVLAPLTFERLSLVKSALSLDGSSTVDSFLVVLFIPASASLQQFQEDSDNAINSGENYQEDSDQRNINRDTDLTDSEKEMLTAFGQLAVEFSEPGFIFSWIKGDKPLAKKLIDMYQLKNGNYNLVVVHWKDTHMEDDSEPEGEANEDDNVHVYSCPDLSPQPMKSWFISLKDTLLKPSVYLRENEWHPHMPGFDFIKFMMEDEDRDAEDQLVMEMEKDLRSPAYHGGESESFIHMNKEL